MGSSTGFADIEGGKNSHREAPEFPRVVRRNMAFHQSKNKVAVHHSIPHLLGAWRLVKSDWFHVMLRMPVRYSITLLLSVWTGAILLFAGLYIMFDALNEKEQCRLGLSSEERFDYGAAFAFSLETCTTVGYGLPSGTNAYFEECQALQFLAYCQMVWSMLFNAFLFSFLVNRLARAETRGTQVVFSKDAIVSMESGRNIGGDPQIRFQFRVFDLDAVHPIVEASVRVYAIMRRRPIPRPLRLIQPNDEHGAQLFLSFPSVVTHHIDAYSMLHPPRDSKSIQQDLLSHGLILRQVDSATSNREEVICPVCCESFGTHARWVQHVKYSQWSEQTEETESEKVVCPVCAQSFDSREMFETHLRYQQHIVEKDLKDSPFSHHRLKDEDMEQLFTDDEELPTKDSHLSISEEDLKAPPCVSLDELQEYFKREVAEIVCVVEGVDPLLSGTFQSLHSYRAEDIVWDKDARFAPCVKVDKGIKGGNGVRVDLDRFHMIESDPALQNQATLVPDDPIDLKHSSEAASPSKAPSNGAANGKGTRDKQQVGRKKRYKQWSNRKHDSFFQEPMNREEGNNRESAIDSSEVTS